MFSSTYSLFEDALTATVRLRELGYLVGINLMQIADRTDAEIEDVARRAAESPPDVLYFADSLGSMDATQTSHIVGVWPHETIATAPLRLSAKICMASRISIT